MLISWAAVRASVGRRVGWEAKVALSSRNEPRAGLANGNITEPQILAENAILNVSVATSFKK